MNQQLSDGGVKCAAADHLAHGLHAFEATDHALDVVIDPDKTWHWKDEADLVDTAQPARGG